MKVNVLGFAVLLGLATAISDCGSNATPPERLSAAEPPPPRIPGSEPPQDPMREACRRDIARAMANPRAPGAPEFDRHRAEILGRARGEAVLFVEEPRITPDARLSRVAKRTRTALARRSPLRRVSGWRRLLRGNPAGLRSLVLRDGYLYSSEPQEALALVARVRLTDLFDEPEIALQRGARIDTLRRVEARSPAYVYVSGEQIGETAVLLLGDRVAPTAADLGVPWHRDLAGLTREEGCDRIQPVHMTRNALVARLRYGGQWVRTLLQADGARLHVKCLDEPAALRRAVAAWKRADAPRRRALAALREAVRQQISERLPFDRPRGEKSIDHDGSLRREWRTAYRQRRNAFQFDGESYPVFDSRGNPLPPQMCVDFVLDSFERGAGTWFRRRGEPPGRTSGGLDFGAFGIENRRGVLSFGRFAEQRPAQFDTLKLSPEHRIPFRNRTAYFAFLVDHSDLFAPGDVVAIRGRKRDGLIHQHAILIEDTDPITGFPHALADQMRWPRRRTWEGIMAEAPARSLYFRVRLAPTLLAALDR